MNNEPLEQRISDGLKAWWAKREVEMTSDPLAAAVPAAGTVFDIGTAIDSISVLDGLLELEKICGGKIPVSVIQKGGYSSYDEMVANIIPKIISKLKK